MGKSQYFRVNIQRGEHQHYSVNTIHVHQFSLHLYRQEKVQETSYQVLIYSYIAY